MLTIKRKFHHRNSKLLYSSAAFISGFAATIIVMHGIPQTNSRNDASIIRPTAHTASTSGQPTGSSVATQPNATDQAPAANASTVQAPFYMNYANSPAAVSQTTDSGSMTTVPTTAEATTPTTATDSSSTSDTTSSSSDSTQTTTDPGAPTDVTLPTNTGTDVNTGLGVSL